MLFESRNSSGVTPSDGHIIDIKNQDHKTGLRSSAKHSIISQTLCIPNGKKRLTKALKPSTRCLLESIKCPTEFTHMARWNINTWGWQHINDLGEVTIQKSVL